MKKKISGKTIFNIIVFALCAGLLGYFFLADDGLLVFLSNSPQLDIGWLCMAVVCHLINMCIDAFLIYRFTSNISKYSLRNAIKSSMVGQFFSAVTPGASGGQPMQIYVMSKQGVDGGAATSALIQKFLVYQTVLTGYSAFTILVRFDYFNNTLNKVMWSLAMFGFLTQALVIFVLLLFSFNRKLTSKIIRFLFLLLGKIHILKNAEERFAKLEIQLTHFHSSNKELYKNKKLVVETTVLTAIQLTAMFLVPYCVYRSFHLQGAGVIDMICAQSFTTMVSSFMPLPGASGAAEGASLVFLSSFFDQNTLKSAVLISRLISYYFTILISAPFARLTKSKVNQLPEQSVEGG